MLPVPVSAGSMAGPCRSSRSPTRDTRDFGESVDARSDAGKADSKNPGRIKNFNRYDVRKIIKWKLLIINRFFTSSEPLPTSINFDSKLSKLQFLLSLKWSALKHLLSIKMIMKKQLMFCKTRLISSIRHLPFVPKSKMAEVLLKCSSHCTKLCRSRHQEWLRLRTRWLRSIKDKNFNWRWEVLLLPQSYCKLICSSKVLILLMTRMLNS